MDEDRAGRLRAARMADIRQLVSLWELLYRGLDSPEVPWQGDAEAWFARVVAVRLANVVTLPAHRGRGYGTLVVRDVIAWAHTIKADRVDLAATAEGQRIYEGLGFTGTSAPRMKLML